MNITFPGGLRVEAIHEGHRIRTDQPVIAGGEGTAPSPFDLFLASIGTCAGYYALRFLQQRNLDTEGLVVTMTADSGGPGQHVDRIRIDVTLPPAFPQKYRDALLRAIDQCKVKRHLAEPPVVEVVARTPARALGRHSSAGLHAASAPYGEASSMRGHRASPPSLSPSFSGR